MVVALFCFRQTGSMVVVSNEQPSHCPTPHSIMQQIKLAFRTLSRTPFVTGVAIISLALGIGANAGIYSVFNQMLRQPLPVPNPAALVNIAAPGPNPGSQSCGLAGTCEVVFTNPMFRDLEKAQTSFTGIAAHSLFGANFSMRERSSDGQGTMVSGSYFSVLGIKPAIGRLLNNSDDEVRGASFVAVLSYDFWQTQFGGDPNVINERMTINGKPYTIVGVAPDGFQGTTIGAQPKVYVPISMRSEINPNFRDFDNRSSYWAYLFARLKPGVTADQAAAQLNTIFKPILRDVEAPLITVLSPATLEKFKAKSIVLTGGGQGQSMLRQRAERPLYMLLGVSAMVLLIACANIANLLLARGANRAMEISVRLALGASRRHLLTQLMTESLLLAIVGGAVSLLVAKVTLIGIASMLPAPTAAAMHLDLSASVIVFASGLSIATGFLFGVFPAWHSTRSGLVTSIRANAGNITGARTAARFRTSLVVVQVALSMSLLIAAGLFLRSLVNINNVKLGSSIDNMVSLGIAPQRSGYDADRARALYARIEQEIRAIPGVTSVSESTIGLLTGNNSNSDVRVQGFSDDLEVDHNSGTYTIGAGYFRTMGIQLVAGREFAESDNVNAARAVIVNEAFVKKFKLGENAVGAYMATGNRDSLNMQIIGVTRDFKTSDAKADVPPMFFTAWMQERGAGSMTFYVRSTLPMDQITRAIPALMSRIDPTLPVRVKTVPDQFRESVYIDLMISKLSAAFAVLATLLAGVGLYGVLAYTVAQRTREIGVRMALGADSLRVKTMVLKQVGGMLATGGLLGLAGAIGLGKASASLLFGMKATDPVVFALSIVVLGVVAMSAAYLPARRASKVHPMQALRYE